MPSNSTFQMFEDSGGNIWVSTMANDAGTGIARLKKGADKFHKFTESEGLPAGKAFSSAVEDLQGNVWFSLYDGEVARFRNGKIEYYEKDRLQDLTQRMRRFAAEVLTAKEIDLEFTVPETDHEISLGANIRREVFVIFKETVNNIAKHSESTEAKIAFSMRNNQLVISFADNGKGFDQNEKASENGNAERNARYFKHSA